MVRRRIKVDHRRNRFDVNTSRGHVGGDERLCSAVGEGFQRTIALVLRPTAVHGHRVNVVIRKLTSETICAVAGAGEHDGSVRHF